MALGAVDQGSTSDAAVPEEAPEPSEDADRQPALAAVDDEAGGGTSYDVAVPVGLLVAGLLAVAVVVWRRRVSR